MWISAKATVAQYLIADAWQQTLQSGRPIPPWQWADTWPIAKLVIPSLNKQWFVLAGSHGTSLAFGPGHLDGSALPGTKGTTVFNGHRDTHFRLLEKLNVGDSLQIQIPSGQWHQYTVSDIHIIDIRDMEWTIDNRIETLLLITCYPFNSVILNPSHRYIVQAERDYHDTKHE